MTDKLSIGVTTPAMFQDDTPEEKTRRTAAFTEALAANHLAALNQPAASDPGYAPHGCRILGTISDFPELQAQIRKGLEDGTLSVS